MFLSVVIPVYKVEQYLDECVRSVLQVKNDLEVILVDDGSPDRCGEMCDEWARKDARVKVIHQINGGLSAARNTGIQNSKGDYILLLDSDDYLDAAETDRLLEKCSGDVDVVMGLYREAYTDSDERTDENSPAFLTLQGLVSIETFLQALPYDGNTCALTAWRFICKRSFLLEHDLMFLPGIYHEDEEWNQRLFCAAKELCVTHCHFYQYRQARAGSIMVTVKPKRVYDSFVIIRKGNELLQKQETGEAQRVYLQKQLSWIYFATVRDSFVLGKEDWKNVRAEYQAYGKYLKYNPSLKGKVVYYCQKILGVRITGSLLHIMQVLKKPAK